MSVVEVPSPSASRLRRPGRRSVDTEFLRTRRLDIDVSAAEFERCQQIAAAAALPLRRWARQVLLGVPVSAVRPAELRELWAASSTLQSNFNQLCARLNELHQAGDLRLDSAETTLRNLAALAPELHRLVCLMRVELAALRGRT